MKKLEKYTSLEDDVFGRLAKCFLYYMKHQDIPANIDNETEILFRNTLQKQCDEQIRNTQRKRNKRKEINDERN